MTFRLRHLVAAAVLHVVLLGLVAGGLQCSAKPVQPPVITGVLLDPSRKDVAERKRAEQRRQAEAERKRREDEARRAAEQQKKAEAQKRAQAEAKKKQEAEALRQKQLAEKKAAEQKAAEKKKADEAAKRQREQQEQAAREAATRREAERVEKAMQDEAARREAERAAQALAEDERLGKTAEWVEALVAHIQDRYTRPAGTPDTYSCKVRMQLLPDGSVTNVSVVKSCGSPLVDQAVMAAVNNASPMPLPADRSVFDPDLTINFNP
jgi:colicin import membrane protein